MDIKEEILAQMDSALRPEFDKAIDNTIEGAFKEDVKTLGFMVANSIKCQWEVMKPHLFYAYCLGVKAQEAKAQADQKVKLLLCDEHLKKCESPTGIFNSQYPDEEPCLICLAKEAKAQAVPEWISTSERMPNEGEEVFVHYYGQISQATRDKKYSGGFKQRNCYGWESVSSYISHWMPKSIELPEPYHFYYENDAKQKALTEAQGPAND